MNLNENYIQQSDNWLNIQEPIKDVLISIIKAIHTQSYDIQSIDKKISSSCVPNDKFDKVLADTFRKLLSKDEGREMFTSIESKASRNELNVIDAKLSQSLDKLTTLATIMEQQSQQISNFRDRMTRLEADVHDMKGSYYDRIIEYIDKQVVRTYDDFDKKLATKAEVHMMETVVPQRLEDSYRFLTNSIADIKSDLNRKATKDDIHLLASTKADGKEVHDIHSKFGDCITRYELHREVNDQVRPIVTAIASLEKTIGIQDQMIARQQSSPSQSASSLAASNSHDITKDFSPLQMERLHSLIQKELDERDERGVIPSTVTSTLQDNNKKLLRDVQKITDTNKTELIHIQANLIDELRKDYEQRIESTTNIAIESRERSIKTKQGLKEFATNVAKALGKKMERDDVPVMQDHRHVSINKYDDSNDIPVRKASNLSSPASPSKQSVNESVNKEKEMMETVNQQLNVLNDGHNNIQRDLLNVHEMFLNLRNELNDIRAAQDNQYDRIVLLTKEMKQEETNKTEKSVVAASNDSGNDWRLALGDISLNLKRELMEKVGREEMYTNVRKEYQSLEQKLLDMQHHQDSLPSIESISALENDIVSIKSKLLTSMTQGRWLWTSGSIVQGGWIPWDSEALNSSTNVFAWKKGGSAILVRVPGLYKLTVAIFTALPVAAQVCLNGEPIVALQPDTTIPKSAAVHPSVISSKGLLNDQSYNVRRYRHSAGDVTCISIDEYVTLPLDGAIAVKFHSQTAAQAFLALAKI